MIRDRKYGYRPNPPHLAVRASRLPLLGRSLEVGTVSLKQYLPRVLDQTNTSSCLGHGYATMIYATMAAARNPLPFIPSPDYLYKMARAIERRESGLPIDTRLVDDGTYPAYMVEALSQWGVNPMKPGVDYSDCHESTVNTEPDLLDMENGRLRLVVGDYSIEEYGTNLASMIQMSLKAGQLVGFGIKADRAFEAWRPSNGPVTAPDLSQYLGGHWLVAHTLTVEPDMTVKVGFRNSWGVEWGDNGDGIGNQAFMNAWMEVRVCTCTAFQEAA